MSEDDDLDDEEGHGAEEFDGYDATSWEESAAQAVDRALENAEYDDIRGVIAFSDEDDERFGTECVSQEQVKAHLTELYEQAWYAHVPFESGESVFEADAIGYVEDALGDRDLEAFFAAVRDLNEGERLLGSKDLVEDSNRSKILRIDLQEINAELIRHLAAHPEMMRRLDPRKFEQLVAELFRDKGYEVTLTPRSNDGGLDILAIEKSDIGSALTLIECKRYAKSNRVGVDIVRGLYGVVEQKKATRGIIATTSFFTKGAKAFRDTLPYRLGLADYDNLKKFLDEFGRKRRKKSV